VIHHVVWHGAALALAATELQSGVNLYDMATGFLPVERPDVVC
jgi:hypothetical protein